MTQHHTPPPRNEQQILVLGIGNLLWADEGFGVRCAEALTARWRFDERVTVMDGGTQGVYLLPFVQAADCLLIFDAIDWGDPPGTLREVIGDDVPRFLGAKKMSLHQTGFQEVLSLAAWTGQLPAEIVLIGVQPETLVDYGGSLSPVVKEQLADALQRAETWLGRWQALGAPLNAYGEAPALHAPALDLQPYETGRPDAAAACRFGDARFLNA